MKKSVEFYKTSEGRIVEDLFENELPIRKEIHFLQVMDSKHLYTCPECLFFFNNSNRLEFTIK